MVSYWKCAVVVGVTLQTLLLWLAAAQDDNGNESESTGQEQATPSNAIQQVWLANATEHSLMVGWRTRLAASKMPVPGEITVTNFLIKSYIVSTYSSLPVYRQPEFLVQGTELGFELTDLMPATAYNISVSAMCGPVVCGGGTLLGTTIIGLPSPAPKAPSIVERYYNTMIIDIPAVRNDNGPVTKLLVIVERVDDSLSQSFDATLLGSWQQAQQDGLPYYIAAELVSEGEQQQNRTQRFVVGDGKRYGNYVNPPLDTEKSDDRHVHISLGVVSSLHGVTKTLYTRAMHDQHGGDDGTTALDTFTYATFESGRESIIALTVTCVVFGCCLVLSLVTYGYLRYRTRQTRRRGHGRLGNAHEMTMQQPIIERENNGFMVDSDVPVAGNFKEQLDGLLDQLAATKRLPRNALRMNVNDILAEGRYGEVIAGSLVAPAVQAEGNVAAQLHVLALDDLTSTDQAHLLREFRNILKLQQHDSLLNFYGVSASTDWFYFVFEQQSVSLKRRLVQSRRAPNSAPVQRITALSEQLVLQWLYELASAMEYLGQCRVVHRQLCSHNVFVTAESRLKLAVFGPVHYVNNQQQIDVTRWLAPEVLRHQHYSAKSDVWAFACVAWECAALGGTPYANITSNAQLLDAIKSGARPAQPAYVYHDLYQLLLNCWQLEPSERTTFEDIALGVRQLMTSPKHALNFDRTPELPGSNVLDTLPFYLPMLETQH